MLTHLLAGAALLLAPSVALAQEFPPLVVVNVQVSESISADIEIALGDPCADAIQALREEGLRQIQAEVFPEAYLVLVLTKQGAQRGVATLVCAPEEKEPEPEPE